MGLMERLGLRRSGATDAPPAFDQVVKLEGFDDDRHVAFGWAYVAEVFDKSTGQMQRVVDHSNEFVEPGALEDAAYVFALQYRVGDEEHTETIKTYLIESVAFTPEKLTKWATDADGTVDDAKLAVLKDTFGSSWWTGWYVPDDAMWKRIREGELPMLSIGGLAQKELVDA